jgi:hypothetical protein
VNGHNGDTLTVDEEAGVVDFGGIRLAIEPGNDEPGEGERKANRKERRDYIRALPRFMRLAYGFGKVHHLPGGVFVRPATPRD